MKKRKMESCRVVYGFSGRLQDDLERYQGFMEIAEPSGWRVVVLHGQFESRVRTLVKAGAVDAVAGDFISELWLRGLPGEVMGVHMGDGRFSDDVPAVGINGADLGRRAARHLNDMGYPRRLLLGHQLPQGLRNAFEAEEPGRALRCRSFEDAEKLLSNGPETGVFCLSDYDARRGIRLADRLGKPVPDPLGFLGVGDRFWDGILAETGISSFQVENREVGRAAARLLSEQLQGEPVRHVRIPVGRLVVRSSTRKTGGGGLEARFESLVAHRLENPPDMAEAARQLGMSRRSFENAFARAAECTPYEFLLRLRTEEAKRLLRSSTWSVARVGAAVGIPDPPRFNAFFKKRTGVPPGEWRNQSESGRA